MQSEMKIKNYEAWVSLGCSKEEQSLTQPVVFNVQITFDQSVVAEVSDKLTDSLDYVALTDVIRATAESKSYSMIEHLCFNVTTALKQKINHKYQGTLVVAAQKVRAPVKNLHDGVEWTCKIAL